MTDLDDRNIPFYWSTFFFRNLLQQGVQHVVISPGSRSTPLTLAAAAHPHLEKHVILDERSAAFTALGIGKSTGTPAVLVCTSGTALANYYAAVIEAQQSGIPMILATADRPPHLRATGANQAIDQLKIFGDYPVFFHEVGEPVLQDPDLDRLQLLAHQSVSMAKQERGPVHLNFPFRKPLEPAPSFVQNIEEENRKRIQPKPFLPTPKDDLSSIRGSLQQAIGQAERPLIIIGPTAPGDDTSAIASLAKKLQCPVLSESTIESDYAITGFSGFLRNKQTIGHLEPDILLRFGFQPTAKGLELALKQWSDVNHIHFASTSAWHDAAFSESTHLPWPGTSLVLDHIAPSTNSGWFAEWQQIEHKFNNYLEQSLNQFETLTDGHIYAEILPQCKGADFIAVSNSFPARDIQLFGRGVIQHALFLNRGASGIDGVTSTAMGVSLGSNQSGILFTGDLAFLHDSNALLSQKIIEQHLTVIVINNAGGSIFRMLPIEQHDKYFKDYFETPQSANISKLVSSHDIPFKKITTVSELQNFHLDRWQQEHAAMSVVECQTDADSSMELRKKVWNVH